MMQDIPISVSPLIICQFKGDPPLYFGNFPACKLIVPFKDESISSLLNINGQPAAINK